MTVTRLFFLESLPGELVPTLAIELAPPTVAGSAYFEVHSSAPGPVAYGFAGYAVLMVLVQASQLEYSPDGIPSGLCVAVATDLFQGEPITLQPCTVPGRTVFIIDTMDSPATAAMGLFPLVSGATEDFAHPFTMSYPRHPNTAKTLPPIRLRHMKFSGPGRTVPANQLWGVASGIQ